MSKWVKTSSVPVREGQLEREDIQGRVMVGLAGRRVAS